MHPSESLIQWMNYQRRRAAEMNKVAIAVPAESSSSPVRQSLKLKVKEKKKEVKEMKGLQDLRASISNPGVMLKILCHSSREAKSEYDRFRVAEASNSSAAATVAETSTTTTTLSAAAQVQLKAYFRIVPRVLNLPTDIITKDAFILGDFDSLYAYVAFLYLFHPNYIAPGQSLSPRHHISFDFFAPQWEKIQKKLTDESFDPLAQQQYYIFLAKVRRIHRQFLRFEEVARSVDKIARYHQDAVLRDTFNDLVRRVLGKDSNISVALEKETLAAWVSLSPAKLLSLCENEDELKAIEQIFKENVLDLVKIFRIYGSGAGGKGILEQEFLKVMTRAGVTEKKNILRSHLQHIYHQSRQGATQGPSPTIQSPANGSDDEDDSTGNTEDRGATPNEFFEALVRVAYHTFQRRKDGASGIASPAAGTGAGLTLLSHVVELVVDKVIPLTKKFQEQGLMFKKLMVHPDVQYVCKAQEKRLKRVFASYSMKNKNPGSRGKLMDLSDFEALLKDKRLLDALFPHGRIKQLVAFVQQDGDLAAMGGNGFDSETEFVFSEFVEALAAIAVFRNANPYVPLAKKLEAFFEEIL
ncbi:hypothetical protein PINS_up009160 [Pythium insidiosum]|nr:hypothetical protein PINS_up009160 [Pythium insidiosum]